MPRDGSGVYSAPAGSWNPAVPGTTIGSAAWNALLADLVANTPVYLEGTFTPVLAFGGASVGITYTNQEGRYTKIGRVVYIEIYIVLSSKGSSVGNASITGLPFTSNATTQVVIPFYQTLVTLTTGSGYTSAVGSLGTATTSINLRELGSAVGPNSLTDTQFQNTSNIRLTGFYSV